METATNTVTKAAAFYDGVNDDCSLPEDFHERGRAVTDLCQVLENIKITLGKRSLAGDTKLATEQLNSNAKLLLAIFQRVAEAPKGSRSAHYQQALREVGNGQTAGFLLIRVMNDVCTLAENDAIRPAMEEDVKRLRGGIEKLQRSDSNRPANYFYGQTQNNHVGTGTQNNTNGTGNQFPGGVFNGSMTFNG